MHTLPTEISESIGTSTLFAAWNAAIYVAQIEDDRLAEVVGDGRYLDATREVLQRARRAVVLRRVLRDLAAARLRQRWPTMLSLRWRRRRAEGVRPRSPLHARLLARGDAADRGRHRGAEDIAPAGHARLSQRGADAAAGRGRRAGGTRARGRASSRCRISRCASSPAPTRSTSFLDAADAAKPDVRRAAGDRRRPRPSRPDRSAARSR